jgi:hypothetical protein
MPETGKTALSDTEAEEAPFGVDPTTANVARMWDYYLGGKDNYAVDRETAEKVLARYPELRSVARENRAFLIRAVQFLAGDAGIRQFIDVGSGLPTQRNVHQVAQEIAPDARIVYVDYDRIVTTHARALLRGVPGLVAVVEADLRNPTSILEHPDTRDLIDFNEPAAILLSAILHFVPDEGDPYGLVAQLMKPLVAGSYLALTHAGSREITPRAHEAAGEYRSATAQITLRQQSDVARFFTGLELVEPGVVPITEWHNPTPPSGGVAEDLEGAGYVGVGRKP